MPKLDIDYSSRPNKDLIRQKILELSEKTFPPSDENYEHLVYISFAGYRFLDSIEFYKRFRIKNIYSVEHKPHLYTRAKFNKPYKFFDVTYGSIRDFIDQKLHLVEDKNKILFLDYESRLINGVIIDLERVFSSNIFHKNGLLFITLNAGKEHNWNDISNDVLEILGENVNNEFTYSKWLEDKFSENIVLNQLSREYPTGKKLTELIKVFYSDSKANMFFIGYNVSNIRNISTRIKKLNNAINYTLEPMTEPEKRYINRNIDKNTSSIAKVLGLHHNSIRFYKSNI